MLVSFILLSYFYASTFVLLFSIFHCPGATSIFLTPLFLSFPESKHHFRKLDNVQPVSPTHQLLTQSITLVWNFVPIKTSPIFTLWLCPTSSSSTYTSTQKLTTTTFALPSPETSVIVHGGAGEQQIAEQGPQLKLTSSQLSTITVTNPILM